MQKEIAIFRETNFMKFELSCCNFKVKESDHTNKQHSLHHNDVSCAFDHVKGTFN